jgi:DNA-binding response OmpR family regulator
MARILFIDDDVMTLELMEKAAMLLGHDAVTCTSGGDGLIHAIEMRPDMILVDLGLQDMSGFDFLKILRSISEVGNTPVIMVSAGQSMRDKAETAQAGAEGYLVKPIQLDLLSQTIKKFTSVPAGG